MEDAGFGSSDESLWSPDGDDSFDLGSDLFSDPGGASIPGLMETEGYVPSYLVGGGGGDYAAYTGSEWKEEPSGGGGDTGIRETLEYNVGGATGGGDYGDGYNSSGGGGDVPVNFGTGEAGGAFSSIGTGAASLWKSIGNLVNPISTAITGRPLIQTTTGAAATAAQKAAAQKAQMQNLLVVGALGVGAYLLLAKK